MVNKENKAKIAISLDAQLLRRLDAVCEARQQARSQIIERILFKEIPSEEEFVVDMENPIMRAILNTMLKTPGLVPTIARIVGQEMPPEELERIRGAAAKQMEHGKNRQTTKKGKTTKTPKVEPA